MNEPRKPGADDNEADLPVAASSLMAMRLTPEMLAVVNGGAPTAKTSPTLGHSLSTAIEQRQWQKANQVFCRIIMDLVALRNRGQLPL